jgi:hypothetical protein
MFANENPAKSNTTEAVSIPGFSCFLASEEAKQNRVTIWMEKKKKQNKRKKTFKHENTESLHFFQFALIFVVQPHASPNERTFHLQKKISNK